MNRTLSVLAIVRIITGLLLAYHGLEIFKPEIMQVYKDWDSIKALPGGWIWAYAGKGLELVAGIGLALGCFTRWCAVVGAVVMLFITFYIGEGRFWYEEQHPFLLGLLCAMYIPLQHQVWALDRWLQSNRNKSAQL